MYGGDSSGVFTGRRFGSAFKFEDWACLSLASFRLEILLCILLVMLRVMGIDPGLRLTGYAAVDLARGAIEPTLVEAGVIRLSGQRHRWRRALGSFMRN